MSFFEKARQAADRAAEQAKVAAEKAGAQAKVAAEKAGVEAKAAAQKVRRGLTHERLAELIVRATALQERTNAELRAKQSPYRITEINVTASIPPTIGFVIGRTADPADLAGAVESAELLARRGEDTTLEIETATVDPHVGAPAEEAPPA
jgi:hypothetical protein